MKIIVASFQCEANSKAKLHPQKSDFEYFKGEEIFKKLVVKEIFEKYVDCDIENPIIEEGTTWYSFISNTCLKTASSRIQQPQVKYKKFLSERQLMSLRQNNIE